MEEKSTRSGRRVADRRKQQVDFAGPDRRVGERRSGIERRRVRKG